LYILLRDMEFLCHDTFVSFFCMFICHSLTISTAPSTLSELSPMIHFENEIRIITVATCHFLYSPSYGTYKNIYPIPQRGLTSCTNIYLVMTIVQMMIRKIILLSLQANTIWNIRDMLLCMQSLPPSISMKTIRIIRNIQDVLTVQQENANFKNSGGHGPHISLKAR